MASAGRNAVAFVLVTVALDSIGIGLILPVMPDLIGELTGGGIGDAALWGGWLAFVYAFMQFMFGPTLGNLSDRYGRRPVLLVSLGMLGVDYLIMGFAPTLTLLFIGRLLSGIAGATHATANAFIADVTPPAKRAQRFGLVGAAFGIGFIFGPAIGGLLGEFGTRAPFFAAAGLAFLNLIYGAIVLPETLSPENRRPFSLARANPFGAARNLGKVPMVAWLVVATLFVGLAQWVYPSTWSYFTKEAFDWSPGEIGLSLALVGAGMAIVQGVLIGAILSRLGEARTVRLGIFVNIAAFLGIAAATDGWMIYALMPLSALGVIVTPALTGLMANRVPDNAQGELQGVLSSVMGITAVVSPPLMTQLFGYFVADAAPLRFPGAPYFAAAMLVAVALVPLSIGLRRAT